MWRAISNYICKQLVMEMYFCTPHHKEDTGVQVAVVKIQRTSFIHREKKNSNHSMIRA